jgi:hypothetical protein
VPTRVFRQEPNHAYLRQEYNLDVWIEKPPDRAPTYFRSIDELRRIIENAFHVEPQDEDLVQLLEGLLASDDTFVGYLNRRRGDAQLANREFRNEVKRAAAGMILDHYRRACDAGSWPVA